MPRRSAMAQLGVDEQLDVAVEDALGVEGRYAGSGVFDALFGIEEVAADRVAQQAKLPGLRL